MNDDEVARLRRRLRAMAVVNEHLRVQLDALRESSDAPRPGPATTGGGAPTGPRWRPAVRRSQIASAWTSALLDDAAERRREDPALVMRADRGVYVVEGGTRRRLAVPLLALALEQVYGERRPIGEEEFHALTEGPPVELLEAPTGGPFVVVGGRRLPVRGIGLPHAVDQDVLDLVPEGPTLDVSGAAVARRAIAAAEWVGPLTEGLTAGAPDRDVHLAATPDGSVVVVDGRLRRSVPAGLLLPALESVLGERRPISEADLAELEEGPPVELLEGRSGLPFVVVGGRRLPVSGLPLPHPIERSALDGLPEGPVLDTPASVVPRRARAAAAWVDQLVGPPPEQPPELVTSADGKLFVREGAVFRLVKSGLLVPAIEGRLGPRRPATDEEAAAWTEGPPVEIIEGPTGAPFVVIGSVRLPVRNLPLPNPVRPSALDGLPEGPPIDVIAAYRETTKALDAARAQARAREAKPDPTGELKALVDKEGVVRATRKLIRRKPSTPDGT